MADNETTEPQISQAAVLQPGVSDPYEMKPTQQIDLERRLAEENKSSEERLQERREATAKALDSAYRDSENNESIDNFTGTAPEYQQYGGVSHEPMRGDGGAERTVEDRLLQSQADLLENSVKAAGGHTTYGETVEVDPVGRSGAIVRGGSGDVNTATGDSSDPPKAAPAKAEAATKKAAAKE